MAFDLTTQLAKFLGGLGIWLPVRQKTVTLTDSQIKALPTLGSPFGEVVVPAPGAGLALVPLSGRIRTNFSAGAYGNLTASNPVIYGLSFAGDRFAFDILNPQTFTLATNSTTALQAPKTYINADTAIEGDSDAGTDVNTPLVFALFNLASTPLTGGHTNNSMTIAVAYSVFDTVNNVFI